MSEKVRVRFAPSPTGPLHVGGVRTALYNYLFAKKHGGDFILRIEDTDQTRYVPGAEDYIKESLAWAGLSYVEGPDVGGDFGPYRQSDRKHLYREYADKLVETGHAYYAFDTSEELDAMRERLQNAGKSAPKYDMFVRDYMKNSLTLPEDEWRSRLEKGEPHVIRIKIPRNEEIRLYDEIRGWVSVQSSQLDDKVLYKSDGMPTYHLANIVDDHLMKITHVIRGEEWLPSAPLHVYLYRCFGWEEPKFAHLPLILKPDGNGKLSKRDGDRLGFPVFPLSWELPDSNEKITGYRESGYLPEAFVNILVMLGWNPGTNQEIFTMDELINAFSLERVGKSGAKFDPEKAKWYNQQFLRRKDNSELVPLFKPQLEAHGIESTDNYIAGVIELIKEKASFIAEFWEIGSYFFTDPKSYDEKVVRKKWTTEVPEFLDGLARELAVTEKFTAENVEAAYKSYCETKEVGPGKYMQTLRLALSGQGAGPAIFEMMSLMGAALCVKRIRKAIDTIKVEA